MPRGRRCAIVGFACLLAWASDALAQGATAGPFGFRKGMTAAQAGSLVPPLEEGPVGIYRTERAPRPDPRFQSYWLVITPQTGLCAVMAASKAVDVGPDGAQIKDAFAKAMDAMSRTYGMPAAVRDALQSGSPYVAPSDWSAGLAAQHRVLVGMWKLQAHPAGLSAISLEAAGLSASRAYLRAVFGFDNEGACIEELKQIRLK